MPSTPIALIALADTPSAPLPKLVEECHHIHLRHLLPLMRDNRLETKSIERALIPSLRYVLTELNKDILIFHFAGHSFSKGLVMEDGRLFAEGLTDVLSNMSKLQFVFLNSCSSMDQAWMLAEKGISLVLATKLPVQDNLAAKFADSFYHGLVKGMSFFEASKNAASWHNSEGGNLRTVGFETEYEENMNIADIQESKWKLIYQKGKEGLLHKTLYDLIEDIVKYPKALNSIPFLDIESDTVGLTEDLSTLRRRLASAKRPVNIQGIAGTGKSTLAKAYVQRYMDKYDHILWTTQYGSITETLTTDKHLVTSLGLLHEVESSETLYYLLCDALKKVKGTNLLVISDARDDVHSFIRPLMSQYNWKILITSEFKLENCLYHKVKAPKQELAFRLFSKNYRKAFDSDSANELIKLLEFHPLAVKLVAQTGQDANITMEDLLLIARQWIKNDDSDHPRTMQLFDNLIMHFPLDNISHEERAVLLQFTALPNTDLDLGLLYELFGIKDNRDLQYNLSYKLAQLVKKGWLISNPKQNTFRIHGLLKRPLARKFPIRYEDFASLIGSISKLIAIGTETASTLESYQWISFGDEILTKLQGIAWSEKTDFMVNLGRLHMNVGNYHRSIEVLKQCLDTYLAEGTEQYWLAQGYLAESYYNSRAWPESIVLFHSMLQHLLSLSQPDYRKIANTQNNLGATYLKLGILDKAKEHLETAWGLRSEHLPDQHFDLSVSYSNLSLLYQQNGEKTATENLELLKKAAFIRKETGGLYHPGYAEILINSGNILLEMNQVQEASNHFERALIIYYNHYGPSHPKVAKALHDFGSILFLKSEEHEEAASLLEEALKLRMDQNGEVSPQFIKTANNLSLIYLKIKKLDEASNLLKKTIKASKALQKEAPDLEYESIKNLGRFHIAFGNIGKAKIYLEKALSYFEEKHGPEYHLSKQCRNLLAGLGPE